MTRFSILDTSVIDLAVLPHNAALCCAVPCWSRDDSLNEAVAQSRASTVSAIRLLASCKLQTLPDVTDGASTAPSSASSVWFFAGVGIATLAGIILSVRSVMRK